MLSAGLTSPRTTMRLLLISLLFISASLSAEIYKTILPDGSIGYSDTPQENAEIITPPELTPTPAVKLPPKKVPVKDDTQAAVDYQVFQISSPENDATIYDNNGSVTMSLNINPALQTSFKHTISVYLDSQPVAQQLTKNSYTFSNIDRGSHTLSARILGENNEILKTSNDVVIHMKRHSALHKAPTSLWPTLDNQPAITQETSAL